MTLDELYEIWDSDSIIDENHLDRASIASAKLHGKYLRILMQHKVKLAALQSDYNTKRQLKFKYYRGEMTREELAENNWSQWQGLKPLKSEMEEWLTGDSDLNKILIKIEYIKVLIEALESIMGQLKGRDWSIRNAIEWRKFVAGA